MLKKDLFVSELNDIYGKLLTPHQEAIVTSYYDYDLSLAEIAENTGISRQAVRDALVKAGQQLRALEETLGCMAKKRRLRELLRGLQEAAKADKKEEIEQIVVQISDLIGE